MEVPHSVYESAEWRLEAIHDAAESRAESKPRKLDPFTKALLEAIDGWQPPNAQADKRFTPVEAEESSEPIEGAAA